MVDFILTPIIRAHSVVMIIPAKHAAIVDAAAVPAAPARTVPDSALNGSSVRIFTSPKRGWIAD